MSCKDSDDIIGEKIYNFDSTIQFESPNGPTYFK